MCCWLLQPPSDPGRLTKRLRHYLLHILVCTLGGIASICFRFHFQQTLRMHTQGCQGCQGCQMTRNFVRNSKILIARSTIQPFLSKIKSDLLTPLRPLDLYLQCLLKMKPETDWSNSSQCEFQKVHMKTFLIRGQKIHLIFYKDMKNIKLGHTLSFYTHRKIIS